jgi:hypothetical protein
MKTNVIRWCTYTAAVALFCGALLSPTAVAATPEQGGFSAIQGISAQALSADEMKDVSGQLNAYDIAAGLYAEAAKLSKFPKLYADTMKLADWTKQNADAINAAFMKLHIYTPCQTCGK